MSQNKLLKGAMIGAAVGIAAMMLDRRTRNDVMNRMYLLQRDMQYYKQNPNALVEKLEEKKDQALSFYEQISDDVEYAQEKFSELKELTPHVQSLVTDTKDAFQDSKEEYKTIATETASPLLSTPEAPAVDEMAVGGKKNS